MKKEILKKILLSLFLGVMAFGIIGTVSVFASCDVANYRYGSSPVTAYGKCEGIKDDGRGWNNHLEVQCIGYQIKNDGKTYTEKVFSDYDLTLVNIFTTWCSPCVKEIPELQELYKEMKEKGVGVAGVVLDTTDEKGNQDEEAVKKAGILQEKTKAEYPFLIPDTTMMNGRLQGISAFPETFFVDKDGNIVGDTYTGSHTLDEWKEIVEKELKNVSK